LSGVGFRIPRGIVFLFLGAFTVSGCSQVYLPGQTLLKNRQATEAAGLQPSDRTMASEKLQVALESSISGKSVSWKNAKSGASGSVTPIKTWKNDQGDFCRSYSEKFTLATGRTVSRRGVACRMKNAVWKIV